MSVMLRVLHVCHAEGAACLPCAGAALLSWEPFAAMGAVASCSPLPSCESFGQQSTNDGSHYRVLCTASGRVTSVCALPTMKASASWQIIPGPSRS
jgi:hypothetical protein